MSFERLFQNPIPLHEAAAFFVKLKYAEAAPAPVVQDQSMDPSAAGMPDVIQVMTEVARMKLQLAMAYRVYSESLRDPTNTALGEHLKEHADDELEHADYFIRRVAVLHGPVELGALEPPAPATDLNAILTNIMEGEKGAIAALQQLHQLVGENPMKYEIEAMMSLDQHHYDDMMQHMPGGPAQGAGLLAQSPKMAQQASLPETAMGKQQPMPPAPAPLSGPAAGQMPKIARRTYSELLEDRYHEAHTRALEDAAEVELVRGQLRRSTRPVHFERSYIQEEREAGRVGGLVSGAILGGALGGVLAHKATQALGFSPGIAAVTTVGAGAATAIGGAKLLGPVMADSAAAHAQGIVDRAYASSSLSVKRKKASLELDPETVAYLQQEQEAEQATGENSMAYYRTRFSDALSQLQQSQEQMQAQQEQIQDLQEQLAQAQQQSQATLSQAQQTNDMATQTAQQAHAVASQAVQTNLQTNQELIQQMQLSANMRNAIDQMKQQMMQVALQPSPPATTMQQSMDMTAGPAAPGAELQDPSMAAADPAAAQQAAEADPAAQAAAQPAQGGAQGATKTAADNAAIVGGLTGAALGGAGAFFEGRKDPKPLQQKIRQLESQQKGSFGASLSLAKARLQQGMQDLSRHHPVAGTLMGAAVGGAHGYVAGPKIRDLVKKTERKPEELPPLQELLPL